MLPDFDTMNETDVREVIVRPLLGRLGFRHGTQANIRTEVSLKYDRAFLGRKNPAKDPPLRGRADYICEAISYGRWVVEVKAPSEALSLDDAQQAHSYSVHPEINATHFLLTNGRLFRLYAVGDLDRPLLDWSYADTESQMMTLFNILGYEAIKKGAGVLKTDVRKPLGKGLPSSLRIVGGTVTYGEHKSDHPLIAGNALTGLAGAVTGIGVQRLEDGRVEATVAVRSPYQQLAELNRLAGLEDFVFLSGDEFVSTDLEAPTVLQNVFEGRLPPGGRFRLMAGSPEMILPIGFSFVVYTQATGYVQNDQFKGVLAFEYDYQIIRGPLTGNPQMDAIIAYSPPTAKVTGEGTFEIQLAPPLA